MGAVEGGFHQTGAALCFSVPQEGLRPPASMVLEVCRLSALCVKNPGSLCSAG